MPELLSNDKRGNFVVDAALMAVCVGLFLITSAAFLPHQSLWVDEATQLSGLSLRPDELAQWLCGRKHFPFGVPLDRNPPVSYWAGWTWSQVFGLSECSMRWFGVVCGALATLAVFASARRAFGRAAAFLTAAVFAISPNVTILSAEIRPYPVLLLLACCGTYCAVRILCDGRSYAASWAWLLAAVAILASYTHFFGLVLAGSLFAGLLLVLWRQNGRTGPILIAGTVVAVCSLGLVPFVTGAAQVGGDDSRAVSAMRPVAGLIKLLYRQASHGAVSISPVANGVAVLCFAAMAAFAAIAREPGNSVKIGFAAALAAGGTVIMAAAFAFTRFDSLSPHYNMWITPLALTLVCSAVAASSRVLRYAAVAAGCGLVGATAYGAVQLARYPAYFAHGPQRQIIEMVRAYGTDDLALIYDDGSDADGQVYFALRYVFGTGLRQYRVATAGESTGSPLVAPFAGGERGELVGLHVRRFIVIRSKSTRSHEIVAQIRRGDRPLGDGSTAGALNASSQWRRLESRLFVAFVTCQVNVFERAGPTAVSLPNGKGGS